MGNKQDDKKHNITGEHLWEERRKEWEKEKKN